MSDGREDKSKLSNESYRGTESYEARSEVNVNELTNSLNITSGNVDEAKGSDFYKGGLGETLNNTSQLESNFNSILSMNNSTNINVTNGSILGNFQNNSLNVNNNVSQKNEYSYEYISYYEEEEVEDLSDTKKVDDNSAFILGDVNKLRGILISPKNRDKDSQNKSPKNKNIVRIQSPIIDVGKRLQMNSPKPIPSPYRKIYQTQKNLEPITQPLHDKVHDVDFHDKNMRPGFESSNMITLFSDNTLQNQDKHVYDFSLSKDNPFAKINKNVTDLNNLHSPSKVNTGSHIGQEGLISIANSLNTNLDDSSKATNSSAIQRSYSREVFDYVNHTDSDNLSESEYRSSSSGDMKMAKVVGENDIDIFQTGLKLRHNHIPYKHKLDNDSSMSKCDLDSDRFKSETDYSGSKLNTETKRSDSRGLFEKQEPNFNVMNVSSSDGKDDSIDIEDEKKNDVYALRDNDGLSITSGNSGANYFNFDQSNEMTNTLNRTNQTVSTFSKSGNINNYVHFSPVNVNTTVDADGVLCEQLDVSENINTTNLSWSKTDIQSPTKPLIESMTLETSKIENEFSQMEVIDEEKKITQKYNNNNMNSNDINDSFELNVKIPSEMLAANISNGDSHAHNENDNVYQDFSGNSIISTSFTSENMEMNKLNRNSLRTNVFYDGRNDVHYSVDSNTTNTKSSDKKGGSQNSIISNMDYFDQHSTNSSTSTDQSIGNKKRENSINGTSLERGRIDSLLISTTNTTNERTASTDTDDQRHSSHDNLLSLNKSSALSRLSIDFGLEEINIGYNSKTSDKSTKRPEINIGNSSFNVEFNADQNSSKMSSLSVSAMKVTTNKSDYDVMASSHDVDKSDVNNNSSSINLVIETLQENDDDKLIQHTNDMKDNQSNSSIDIQIEHMQTSDNQSDNKANIVHTEEYSVQSSIVLSAPHSRRTSTFEVSANIDTLSSSLATDKSENVSAHDTNIGFETNSKNENTVVVESEQNTFDYSFVITDKEKTQVFDDDFETEYVSTEKSTQLSSHLSNKNVNYTMESTGFSSETSASIAKDRSQSLKSTNGNLESSFASNFTFEKTDRTKDVEAKSDIIKNNSYSNSESSAKIKRRKHSINKVNIDENVKLDDYIRNKSRNNRIQFLDAIDFYEPIDFSGVERNTEDKDQDYVPKIPDILRESYEKAKYLQQKQDKYEEEIVVHAYEYIDNVPDKKNRPILKISNAISQRAHCETSSQEELSPSDISASSIDSINKSKNRNARLSITKNIPDTIEPELKESYNYSNPKKSNTKSKFNINSNIYTTKTFATLNKNELIDQNFINTIKNARVGLLSIKNSINSSRQTRVMKETYLSGFRYAPSKLDVSKQMFK